MAATTDPLAPLLARPAIADAVERARQAVDALLTHPSLRASGAGGVASLAGALSVQAATASAALDSPIDSPLDSPIGGGLASTERSTSPDRVRVDGALRVQAEVTGLVATWHRAPRQALARLHLLAAADLADDPEQLGRPTPTAVPRLDTLSAVLSATAAPAVVVAGIVHGELLALAAFVPAAGVVARAASRLTLIDRGLDPLGLIAIEIGHRSLGAAYPAALAAYRGGTAVGLDQWLGHCADAIEESVRAAFEVIDSASG